jgi:DNA polymerase I-like protein with 3'-5' exonuclease and polymerase domains
MRKLNLKSLLTCTVHDSILLDAFNEEKDIICKLIKYVFTDLNSNFKRIFGVDFTLPLKGEISIGTNWGDMETVKG